MQNHQEFTSQLQQVMMQEYIALDMTKNPFTNNPEILSPEQLGYSLVQYSLFTKTVAGLLSNVQETAQKYEWEELRQELARNIGQELGSETKGVSHYDMLIDGLRQVYPKAELCSPSRVTIALDKALTSITLDSHLPYASGAAYALECSVIPELHVVKSLIEKLSLIETGQKALPHVLQEFFQGHLQSWEPSHEAGIRTTTEQYIFRPSLQASFEHGFRDLLTTMDEWWIGLYGEVKSLQTQLEKKKK